MPSSSNGKGAAQHGPIDVCKTIQTFAQRIDSGCKIATVVRSGNDLLIKVKPGENETGSCLRLLYALRMRFPFSSVVAIEDNMQQRVLIQILLHSQSEESKLAKDYVKSYVILRALKSLSSLCFISSVVSFGCMFHASTSISQIE